MKKIILQGLGILFSLGVLLVGGQQVLSANNNNNPNLNSAVLNGTSSVAVLSGSSITASVNGSAHDNGNNHDWASVSWGISTGTTTPHCVDIIPDIHNSTATTTFSITAPASAGTYNVSFVGYTDNSCNDNPSNLLTLSNSVTVYSPATLTVIKHVINDNVGTKTAADFTMTLTGTSSFAGSESGKVFNNLVPGTYTVGENADASYASSTVCDGAATSTITLAAGQNKTCTITNNDKPTTLTVTKIVVNNSGGTKIVSDFPLFIDGSSVTSGVASTTRPGLHTISETGDSNYAASFGGDCSVDGTITLALGDNKSCTITNDDKPGNIVIVKNAVGGDGTFNFTTTGSGISSFSMNTAQSTSTTFSTISTGAYTVSEGNLPTGWDFTSVECSDPTENSTVDGQTATINLAPGETVTCTYTNTKRSSIVVHKDVVSPSGGDVSDSQTFTIHKDGDESGQTISEGNDVTYNDLLPGTYTITEDSNSNYDFDSFTVDGNTDNAGAQITVTAGQTTELTITNKQKQGHLTVIKNVTNHSIGTSAPSDFTMSVAGSGTSQGSFPGSSDGTTITLDPGNYSVSESGPDGYAMSQTENCSGTMTSNGNATCTVTNSDIPAGQGAITVIKDVTNDNGGEATASSFTLQITTTPVAAPAAPADATDTQDIVVPAVLPPTTITVTSGQANFLNASSTYIVSEATSTLPYTQTNISCTNGETTTTDGTVVLSEQQAWVCRIANNDVPGILHVKKVFLKENGGTKTASDFSFSVNNGSSTAFEEDGQNDISVNAGTVYTVREDESEGYTASYDGCTEVTVPNGGEKTCTITNSDIPATLTVVKNTDSQSGNGTFNFSVVATGQDYFNQTFGISTTDNTGTHGPINLKKGTYDVTESGAEGWHLAGVQCQYDGHSIGESLLVPLGGERITVDNGDNVTCTFTNTKKGTLIVKKVVINDNGGTKKAGDFSFMIGEEGTTTPFNQQEDSLKGENDIIENPGTYTVTETSASGYTTTYDNCSNVSVSSGSSTVCTITNNDTAPVTPPDNGGSNGGGGGQTGGGNILPPSRGSVLGASTDVGSTVDGQSCTILLNSFMKRGQKNDPDQVKKLQTFLNAQNLGITVPVTGFFGPLTEQAVAAFQVKYANDILGPWVNAGRMANINKGTGYVFKTTLRWINHLNCLQNPLPPVVL